MDLTTIRHLRADVHDQHEAALAAVCAVAMRAGAILEVAHLQGCRRELEVLQKIEIELLANGRAETRCGTPHVQSAAVTPLTAQASTETPARARESLP